MRTRRYKKVTVYLVLQSVLLVEAVVLLFTEHTTKSHEYENGRTKLIEISNGLRLDIEKLLKRKNELVNFNDKTTKQHQQLNEEKNLLSKHLHEMGNVELHYNYTNIQY